MPFTNATDLARPDAGRTRHPRRRGTVRWRLAAATAAALLVAPGIAACGGDDPIDPAAVGDPTPAADAHEEMRERAEHVMPFDLTTTTHTFTKTEAGGVQEVVAHDPADDETIEAVRSHLAEEVAAFREGDFSDPATIHGHDMAGLAELEAGADEFDVSFEPIDAGGRITYLTDEPELLTALHAWFDHQVADHSRPGMGG